MNKFPFFPEQASSLAGDVDSLYFFIVAVSGFFALLVSVAVVIFAIRYRRRREHEVGAAIHGSTALEVLWSVVPLLIVMVIFAWSASVYLAISRPPRDAMDVYVVGKQWMWKVQHPEGRREINELHVPVGRPVRLTMGSEDVIHSFFIPAFRVKADVVPGRLTTMWFQATKPGRYHLFCAEYCGTQHSGMIGWIEVMEPAAFQAWLAGGAGEGSLASSAVIDPPPASATVRPNRPSSTGPRPAESGRWHVLHDSSWKSRSPVEASDSPVPPASHAW